MRYVKSTNIHEGEVTYGLTWDRRERMLKVVQDFGFGCKMCACKDPKSDRCTGLCFRFPPIGRNHFEVATELGGNAAIVETEWMRNKRIESTRKRNK